MEKLTSKFGGTQAGEEEFHEFLTGAQTKRLEELVAKLAETSEDLLSASDLFGLHMSDEMDQEVNKALDNIVSLLQRQRLQEVHYESIYYNLHKLDGKVDYKKTSKEAGLSMTIKEMLKSNLLAVKRDLFDSIGQKGAVFAGGMFLNVFLDIEIAYMILGVIVLATVCYILEYVDALKSKEDVDFLFRNCVLTMSIFICGITIGIVGHNLILFSNESITLFYEWLPWLENVLSIRAVVIFWSYAHYLIRAQQIVRKNSSFKITISK